MRRLSYKQKGGQPRLFACLDPIAYFGAWSSAFLLLFLLLFWVQDCGERAFVSVLVRLADQERLAVGRHHR